MSDAQAELMRVSPLVLKNAASQRIVYCAGTQRRGCHYTARVPLHCTKIVQKSPVLPSPISYPVNRGRGFSTYPPKDHTVRGPAARAEYCCAIIGSRINAVRGCYTGTARVLHPIEMDLKCPLVRERVYLELRT